MSAVASHLPIPFRITHVTQDNYRTKTLVLDAQMEATPGQFVMAWLPRFDEKPFSLVNADPVTLMITAVGPFSRLVHTLQSGDRLWLRGPFGHGYAVPAVQTHLALVGGGYGVAPLYWLAAEQLRRGATVDVVIGARTAADLLYVDRFGALAGQAPAGRLELHLTTEDGSAGRQGRVTDALASLVSAQRVQGIYECGPHAMLAALQAQATQAALPTQLSWEAYMRCGMGICGACEHDGQVLCLDGPVLAHAA